MWSTYTPITGKTGCTCRKSSFRGSWPGEWTVQFSSPMRISAKMNLSFSQKLWKKWNLIILIGEFVVKNTLKESESSSLFSPSPRCLVPSNTTLHPLHRHPGQWLKLCALRVRITADASIPWVPIASRPPLWIFSLKLAFCIQYWAAGNADWH